MGFEKLKDESNDTAETAGEGNVATAADGERSIFAPPSTCTASSPNGLMAPAGDREP